MHAESVPALVDVLVRDEDNVVRAAAHFIDEGGWS
jgi:hypothetical protein